MEAKLLTPLPVAPSVCVTLSGYEAETLCRMMAQAIAGRDGFSMMRDFIATVRNAA